MKFILLFLFFASLQAEARLYAQKFSLSGKDVPIKEIFSEIENQTGYRFIYTNEMLNDTKKVSFEIKNERIEEILDEIFKHQPLAYTIVEKTIIVKNSKKSDPGKSFESKPLVSATLLPPVTIRGKVVDETGQGIANVNIIEKGSKTGVQTDKDGNFNIEVKTGLATLLFTHIGYKNLQLNASGKEQLLVKMEKTTSELDDVVIIGYQTVLRRDVGGAISSLNSKEIKDIPVNSTLEALTGRLAGVQIATSDGAPGAEADIKIRGGVSITQDNSPLYIIDGVQVENGLSYISPQDIQSVDVLKDASATAIYGARGANGVVIITTKSGRDAKTTVSFNSFAGIRKLANELDVLSPYDFVTYQSERTRGNIADSTSFANTYGSTWSGLDKYKDYPAIDWQQQVFGRNAMMQTDNISISGGSKATQFNLSATYNKEEGILIYTGYERKLINFKFDHTASDKLKVGFTFRYNNQVVDGGGTGGTNAEGITEINKLRSAIKYKPLNTNTNLGIDDYDAQYYDQTNAAGNSLGLTNPVVQSQMSYRKNYTDAVNVGGYLTYTFNKLLSFKSTVGFDINMQKKNAFDDTLTNNSRKNAAGTPIVRIINTTIRTLNNSNVFTLSNAKISSGFSKKNRISLLVGQETFMAKAKSDDIQIGTFPIGITPDKALGQLSLGVPFPLNPVSNSNENGIFSLFTKLDYSYNRKYSATFSVRADASSKFAPERRTGYFPAGSLSWRISQEGFMKKIPVISDMKLRLSYGEAGNNRIADYLYFTTMSAYTSSGGTPISYGLNGVNVPGYVSSYLANPYLQWERAVSRNVGLDVGLFQNRVQLTFDAYINDGKDLLVQAPIPSTSGYASQLENIGTTTNKGIELQLSGDVMRKKDFTWTANLNISSNKNTIKKLAGNQSSYLQASGWGFSGALPDYLVKEGEAVGTIYGFVSDGFYTLDDFNYDPATSRYTVKAGVVNTSYFGVPQPGYIKIKDLNGDGIVDPDNDRQVLGNATPKFYGGLSQQFTYKNFDLSAFVNFSYGNKILNASKIELSNSYNVGTNLLGIMSGRWRAVNPLTGALLQQIVSVSGVQYVVGAAPAVLAAANPNPTIWSPIRTGNYAIAITSWGVEDGSFLRFNNITLGYTLATKVAARMKIKRLRFYATLNNLAVLTNYSGSDPEVSTQRSSPLTPGVDYSAYPRSRSYIFGLNLTL